MSFVKFTEQEKESANASSIVDYLTAHGESVKRAGREYVWDSPSGKVSIHGSEWYSQYEQIGGGAINFVRKFFGLTYPEAVQSLLEQQVGATVIRVPREPKHEDKTPFVLPKRHANMRRVYGYLLHERMIDNQILNYFARAGLIYEDSPYHNAVFVGKNSDGIPVHAQKRATNPSSSFKGNTPGSTAEYSFHYVGSSEKLFVFEAPIDMLAFISMHKCGWENHSYVALCSTADRAALQMLKDNPNIDTVYLCLDNDSAGHAGCKRLADAIHAMGEYTVWRVTPTHKDWDEDLKGLCGREALPASEHYESEPQTSLSMTM